MTSISPCENIFCPRIDCPFLPPSRQSCRRLSIFTGISCPVEIKTATFNITGLTFGPARRHALSAAHPRLFSSGGIWFICIGFAFIADHSRRSRLYARLDWFSRGRDVQFAISKYVYRRCAVPHAKTRFATHIMKTFHYGAGFFG